MTSMRAGTTTPTDTIRTTSSTMRSSPCSLRESLCVHPCLCHYRARRSSARARSSCNPRWHQADSPYAILTSTSSPQPHHHHHLILQSLPAPARTRVYLLPPVPSAFVVCYKPLAARHYYCVGSINARLGQAGRHTTWRSSPLPSLRAVALTSRMASTTLLLLLALGLFVAAVVRLLMVLPLWHSRKKATATPRATASMLAVLGSGTPPPSACWCASDA